MSPARRLPPHRLTVRAAGLTGFAAASVVLAGCSSNAVTGPAAGVSPAAASTTASPQARIGDLIVSGGFVPQPASPDVAAAYLTITNTGSTDDTLVAAGSDAGTATLHRTVGGAMVPLDQLQIPAHTSAGFAPGANHIMIDKPTRALVKGGTVVLTLTFQRAGEVSVDVPITGYPTGGGDDMGTDMGGMDMGGS